MCFLTCFHIFRKCQLIRSPYHPKEDAVFIVLVGIGGTALSPNPNTIRYSALPQQQLLA